MVARPLVDDIHRLAVGKIAGLRLSVVISVHGLYESILQSEAHSFIHENRIADGHFRIVQIGRFGEHFLAKSIDGVGTGIAKSQHFVDFLLRLACRTVVQHSQSVCDAQWRENRAFLCASLTEKAQREVVVGLDQFAFCVGQGDGIRFAPVVGRLVSLRKRKGRHGDGK